MLRVNFVFNCDVVWFVWLFVVCCCLFVCRLNVCVLFAVYRVMLFGVLFYVCVFVLVCVVCLCVLSVIDGVMLYGVLFVRLCLSVCVLLNHVFCDCFVVHCVVLYGVLFVFVCFVCVGVTAFVCILLVIICV